MKIKFKKELVLVAPDSDKEIRIKVNVLDYVIKGVLLIKYKDGWWRPVVYLSKSLNKIKKNYKIYNKEILLIIKRLEN